jgi:hypothetical protein
MNIFNVELRKSDGSYIGVIVWLFNETKQALFYFQFSFYFFIFIFILFYFILFLFLFLFYFIFSFSFLFYFYFILFYFYFQYYFSIFYFIFIFIFIFILFSFHFYFQFFNFIFISVLTGWHYFIFQAGWLATISNFILAETVAYWRAWYCLNRFGKAAFRGNYSGSVFGKLCGTWSVSCINAVFRAYIKVYYWPLEAQTINEMCITELSNIYIFCCTCLYIVIVVVLLMIHWWRILVLAVDGGQWDEACPLSLDSDPAHSSSPINVPLLRARARWLSAIFGLFQLAVCWRERRLNMISRPLLRYSTRGPGASRLSLCSLNERLAALCAPAELKPTFALCGISVGINDNMETSASAGGR